MSNRRGISQVDLLVVLLIILVGLGLILAGVQRFRETAKATSCQNNLKSFALATRNCADIYEGRLPALVDQGD